MARCWSSSTSTSAPTCRSGVSRDAGKAHGGRSRQRDFIRADDPAYQRALEELRANTDTRWSPWRTIDGDDEQQAALAALEAIAEAWAKAMPAEPPHLVAASGRVA